MFAIVFLAGEARLAFAPAPERTVRVAGIGWPEDALGRASVLRVYDSTRPLTDAERADLRLGFGRVHDALLSRTRQQARAGTKIVVWPEASALTSPRTRSRTYGARVSSRARSGSGC